MPCMNLVRLFHAPHLVSLVTESLTHTDCMLCKQQHAENYLCQKADNFQLMKWCAAHTLENQPIYIHMAEEKLPLSLQRLTSLKLRCAPCLNHSITSQHYFWSKLLLLFHLSQLMVDSMPTVWWCFQDALLGLRTSHPLHEQVNSFKYVDSYSDFKYNQNGNWKSYRKHNWTVFLQTRIWATQHLDSGVGLGLGFNYLYDTVSG